MYGLYNFYFRNAVILQLPNKEPLNNDRKPLVPPIPPYINGNDIDNANLQSAEKKNAHLHNIVKHENQLDDKQNMNEPKILNNSTATVRLVNKIEKWSPSTAKYARLSIFGCKVSINHLYQ